jgi:hypothetical protein
VDPNCADGQHSQNKNLMNWHTNERSSKPQILSVRGTPSWKGKAKPASSDKKDKQIIGKFWLNS